MKCGICENKYTQECGHYEPYNIFVESKNGGYVLMQKIGGLRTVGRMRYWPPTKGQIFPDKKSAYKKSWEVKNEPHHEAKGE